MGIYLNKWSGELQLEIKEGCVHGTWMLPLLTNSWIFFYVTTRPWFQENMVSRDKCLHNLNSSYPYREYKKNGNNWCSWHKFPGILNCNFLKLYHILLFDISKQEQFSHVLFSMQVYQMSYMILILYDWNVLRISTKLVNYLIGNQCIVVSITFLIVSSLKLDILTGFGTVRLAEQIINWSDYGNCVNVHTNSLVLVNVSSNTY